MWTQEIWVQLSSVQNHSTPLSLLRIEEPPKVLLPEEALPALLPPAAVQQEQGDTSFNPFMSILPSFFSGNRKRLQERVQVAGALPVTIQVPGHHILSSPTALFYSPYFVSIGYTVIKVGRFSEIYLGV
jgi:hypothetical protein